jgi:hypothetical protein
MSENITICVRCKFYRKHIPVNPFSSVKVWTPEILNEKIKWEESQKEAAINEDMRFKSGSDFDYEPIYYPWCAKWTEESDEYSIDPITGDKSKIYMLCARANANARCPHFEKRE